MKSRRLFLASASPRRAEILRRLGFRIKVVASPSPEVRRPREKPRDYVMRMAEEKARRAADNVKRGAVIISADTAVLTGREVLGKPVNKKDAARMLKLLSGRTHTVISGVALYNTKTGELRRGYEIAEVTFARMSSEEIAWYIESGEPMDKAGAYAIQGLASIFIRRIKGSHFNVMGLPLRRLYELFKDARLEVRAYVVLQGRA